MSSNEHYFRIRFTSSQPISSDHFCYFDGSKDFFTELSNNDLLKLAALCILNEFAPIRNYNVLVDYCKTFDFLDKDRLIHERSKIADHRLPRIYLEDFVSGDKQFWLKFTKTQSGYLYDVEYTGFGFLKKNLTDDTRFIFPLLFLFFLSDHKRNDDLFLLQLSGIAKLAAGWLHEKYRYLVIVKEHTKLTRLINDTKRNNRDKSEINSYINNIIDEMVSRVDPNYTGEGLDYEEAYLDWDKRCSFDYVAYELESYSDKVYSLDDVELNSYSCMWGNSMCKNIISEDSCSVENKKHFKNSVGAFEFAKNNNTVPVMKYTAQAGIIEAIKKEKYYEKALVRIAIKDNDLYCICYILNQYGETLKVGDLVECGLGSQLSKTFFQGVLRNKLDLIFCQEHNKWIKNVDEEYTMSLENDKIFIRHHVYLKDPAIKQEISFDPELFSRNISPLILTSKNLVRKIGDMTISKNEKEVRIKTPGGNFIFPIRFGVYFSKKYNDLI